MRLLALSAMLFLAAACSAPGPASLCERFYEPYPDLVSQRERSPLNAELLDAMAFYNGKDYEKATAAFQRILDRDPFDVTTRIYMVSAELGAGHPYKAEMHLDFLENYKARSYSDQVEWYNALCWLCEGDTGKARQQAAWIASRPQTYRKEATELAKALTK